MMGGNDQQAYDRGTSLFSPDGRIYQVEYAREAVSRGAPSVGVRTADGVVFVAMSRPSSTLMEAESIEKLHKLDDHLGTASAGHVADARQLIDLARRQSQGNRLRYGEPVGVETLTKFVTDHIQENTQRGGTRPYGAALLIGGIDNGEPRLFAADPLGPPTSGRRPSSAAAAPTSRATSKRTGPRSSRSTLASNSPSPRSLPTTTSSSRRIWPSPRSPRPTATGPSPSRRSPRRSRRPG